jgi:hypothetical protein
MSEHKRIQTPFIPALAVPNGACITLPNSHRSTSVFWSHRFTTSSSPQGMEILHLVLGGAPTHSPSIICSFS